MQVILSKKQSFDKISAVREQKDNIYNILKSDIESQVKRTRTTDESSPKNTTLYFNLLLETKDFLKATGNLIDEYQRASDKSIDWRDSNFTTSSCLDKF